MRGMLILGLVIVLWNSCADRQMRAAQQRALAPDGQVVAISERAVTYQKRLERSPLDSKVPLSSVAPTTATTPMGARSMAGWCSS
jgi:hypothetical protein